MKVSRNSPFPQEVYHENSPMFVTEYNGENEQNDDDDAVFDSVVKFTSEEIDLIINNNVTKDNYNELMPRIIIFYKQFYAPGIIPKDHISILQYAIKTVNLEIMQVLYEIDKDVFFEDNLVNKLLNYTNHNNVQQCILAIKWLNKHNLAFYKDRDLYNNIVYLDSVKLYEFLLSELHTEKLNCYDVIVYNNSYNILSKVLKEHADVNAALIITIIQEDNIEMFNIIYPYIRIKSGIYVPVAVKYNAADILRFLIEHKADINALNPDSIVNAISKGSIDTIKYIVDTGLFEELFSNLTINKARGLEMVKFVCENLRYNHDKLITSAIRFNDIESFKYLLEKNNEIFIDDILIKDVEILKLIEANMENDANNKTKIYKKMQDIYRISLSTHGCYQVLQYIYEKYHALTDLKVHPYDIISSIAYCDIKTLKFIEDKYNVSEIINNIGIKMRSSNNIQVLTWIIRNIPNICNVDLFIKYCCNVEVFKLLFSKYSDTINIYKSLYNAAKFNEEIFNWIYDTQIEFNFEEFFANYKYPITFDIIKWCTKHNVELMLNDSYVIDTLIKLRYLEYYYNIDDNAITHIINNNFYINSFNPQCILINYIIEKYPSILDKYKGMLIINNNLYILQCLYTEGFTKINIRHNIYNDDFDIVKWYFSLDNADININFGVILHSYKLRLYKWLCKKLSITPDEESISIDIIDTKKLVEYINSPLENNFD